MIVNKLRIFCMAVFAVFAFGVAAASTASAVEEPPEWLVEGLALTEGLLAETVGTILLVRWESEALTKILNDIECSGIFVGLIGSNGVVVGGKLDLIEKLFNLASEEVTVLGGLSLLCDVTLDGGSLADCAEGIGLALVWPDNLPWESQLELMTVGGVEDVLDKLTGTGGEPGYDVECESLLGIVGSELCESLPGQASALLENSAGTPASVLGWFLPETHEELGICAGGTEHVAEVVSDVSGDTWAVTALLGTRLATAISGG